MVKCRKKAPINLKCFFSLAMMLLYTAARYNHSIPILSFHIRCFLKGTKAASYKCTLLIHIFSACFSGFELNPWPFNLKFTSMSSRLPPPNSSNTVFHFHSTELLAVGCVIMCMTVTSHYEFIRISSGDKLMAFSTTSLLSHHTNLQLTDAAADAI